MSKHAIFQPKRVSDFVITFTTVDFSLKNATQLLENNIGRHCIRCIAQIKPISALEASEGDANVKSCCFSAKAGF